MLTASSASRVCGAEASASLNTATEPTPSSLHARTMRRAISPRFAIRTLLNTKLALGGAQDVSHGRALELCAADEAVSEHVRRIDQEGGGVRTVEGVDAERVPNAVRLDHVAVRIAQDWKPVG